MLNVVDLVGEEVELVLLVPLVQSLTSITLSAYRDVFKLWCARKEGRLGIAVHRSIVNINMEYIVYRS